MATEIQLELLKFRVPLAQAWESATKNLLAREDRIVVEELALLDAVELERTFQSASSHRICDPEMRDRAREDALALVQEKFSGSLPDLPDRDADLLAQHASLWSLIGKLVQTSASSGLTSRVVEVAVPILESGHRNMSTAGEYWKQRAKNILQTLASIKGQLCDESIASLCLSDTFLCERELVGPSVKLLTKSKRFKAVMGAPDMVSDGEKTLPKLLMNLSEDKEFRRTFVWLPLDPESPLNESGGSGMIPTNKDDYRFILSIIMKILFGKLRQRGHGIDKRSSFHERHNQIMSYLGTVPVSEMHIVFETLFGRIVHEGISMDKIQLKWAGSEFQDESSGLDVLNKDFISSNSSVKMGVVQLMAHVVSQMKRKVDRFVPLMACYVVSLLVWTDVEEENGKNIHKSCLLRLKDLMQAYSHVGAEAWNKTLMPITDVLIDHLKRSSSAQISTVFKIVTKWTRSESLIDLFSLSVGQALVPVLFAARKMSGDVAKSLFESVMVLCGEDPDVGKSYSSSYQNSKRLKLKEHKRSGGADDDSEDEDMDAESDPQRYFEESKYSHIVLEHAGSIMSSLSMSLTDRDLDLRLIVTLSRLASSRKVGLPVEACAKLLELLADRTNKVVIRKKNRNRAQLCTMFEAISALSCLVPSDEIPGNLLSSLSNCVLTLDDVVGRLAMAKSIAALSRKVALQEVEAADKLVELNAVKGLQPDVDLHVDILQDILDSEEIHIQKFKLASILLIKHCLFLLSSEACDTTVRHCAERFVMVSCCPQGGDLPFDRLVMVMAQVHRMFTIMTSDGVRKSALKIVTYFVSNLAERIDDSSEYSRLLHKDLFPFISILEELQHMQKHRRARGLAKLVDSQISDYSRKNILLPIALEAVLQPGVAKASFDAGLADTGIRAIQSSSCGNPIGLAISLLKVHLRKFPEREKLIFKACQKIAEYLRNTQTSGGLVDGKVVSVIIPLLRRKIWDSKGSLKGSSLMNDNSDKHKLAGKDKEAKEGIVKIDAVVALLEFVQLLPSEQFNDQINQLVRIVVQGLPSREIENRRASREALRRCVRAMGPLKVAYLMKEVRMALPRGGYQAGVAVFTCFSILEALSLDTSKELVWGKPESVAVAEEVLNLLRIEDAQWAALQTNAPQQDQENEIAKQCVEVKRHKGHELLRLASKILHPSSVIGVLLRSVYQLLNSVEGYVDHGVAVEEEEENRIENIQAESEDLSDSDSEMEKKLLKKRKNRTQRDVQLNSCYGKKYFSRTESALNNLVDGMLENRELNQDSKLAVCMQSLAKFEDIVSRKFRLDESGLFAKAEISQDLLRIDDHDDTTTDVVVKRRKIDLRQKQRDTTFLVQPGASTGRGHWVTEEWKKGHMTPTTDKRSMQIGSSDLQAVKARILGSLGLKVLNVCSVLESEEIRTALAKFVTRAFCSGIAELFQPAAKAVQRLLDVLNSKAKSLVAKKLVSRMEQLHHSGSDLSFITLKQQKKVAQAAIASTCSSLLLSLISTEDQSEIWLNQAMMDTLASHVRASLDVSALQVSGLQLLRKLISFKKFRSATLYDCFKSVGDLLVTASNQKVCALAGQLYAHFLVDFPHTEKSLMAKLLGILKQSQTASEALSRCTALNTLYIFVKVVPGKTLQDVFGEIIFVSLSVMVSSEEDANTKEMLSKVLLLVVSRFVDPVKRNRLLTVITEWPQTMTKHQFVFSSPEVASLVYQEGLLPIEIAAPVVDNVIRQLPFFETESVGVQGNLSVIKSVSRLANSSAVSSSCQMLGKSLQFVLGHTLRVESAHVSVVVEALKLAGSVRKDLIVQDSSEEMESLTLIKDQLTGSLEPWPLMMRVLRVLLRDSTESNLEIACVAMRSIAYLLPLCSGDSNQEEPTQECVAKIPTSPVVDPELGLFNSAIQIETSNSGIDESITVRNMTESERLCALLKKIRFEVRRLMAKSRESIVRLASLLKLTTALLLSLVPTEGDDVLFTALEVLVRLATINKVAEEVSTEVPEVNSLFELSILRPIEQIGCLCKMANGAIESIEKHFRTIPAFFTKQLTAATASINKGRRDRKISLLNLAVSNPGRLAMLRLQKSKKKTEKRQIAAKEKVKRIRGLMN